MRIEESGSRGTPVLLHAQDESEAKFLRAVFEIVRFFKNEEDEVIKYDER